MKQFLVVIRGSMSQADIKRLRKAGLCVVECDSLLDVSFRNVDGDMTLQDRAALKTLHEYLNHPNNHDTWTRNSMRSYFASILLGMAPLSVKK